jgi:hypothetical protein
MSMGRAESVGRRLLVALADGSPAFRGRPYLAVGGFGRCLLIAIAEATPAFRRLPAGESLDMGTGIFGHPGRDIASPAAPGRAGLTGEAKSVHQPMTRSEDTSAPRHRPDAGPGTRAHDRAGHILPDEELEELLGAIGNVAPRPAQRACRASTRHATMDLLATPENGGFTVAIRITSTSAYRVRVGAQTIALEVNGEYFITLMTPDGSATFRNIPPGEWNLRRLRGRYSHPGDGPSLALPLPRGQTELAAAGRLKGTAVLKAVLPDVQARLILHRERQGDYLVEIEAAGTHAKAPLVLAMRYGTPGGGEGLVVIPAQRSGLARLTGFSPAHPWQASPVTAAEIRAMGADAITASVRAAANNATRRAWREIGVTVPEFRQLIDRELGGIG